jgi:hypothetical protein
MIRKATLITFASLLAILLCAATASAGPLYSNFGPGMTYDNNYNTSGWYVGYTGTPGQNEVIAMPFIPNRTANVTNAILALGWVPGTPNTPINVYLESDTGLGYPGTILATLTQVGSIPNGPSGGGLVTFLAPTHPLVTAGTEYWIVAQEPDLTSSQGWFFTVGDPTGPFAYDENNSPTGPWTATTNDVSAFEVNAPEPSSLILFGSGILGLAGILRKKIIG